VGRDDDDDDDDDDDGDGVVAGVYDDLLNGGCSEDPGSRIRSVSARQVELLRCRHCCPQPHRTRSGQRQRSIDPTIIQTGQPPLIDCSFIHSFIHSICHSFIHSFIHSILAYFIDHSFVRW